MKHKSVRLLCILLSVLLTAMSSIVISGATVKFPLGDMDLDGIVTSADARFALRCSVELEVFSVAHQKVGDVNGDGVISADDARRILRVSVGLEKLSSESVSVEEEDFEAMIKPSFDPSLFEWVYPPYPDFNAPSGTFLFTSYGYGHGVGLSQYGALTLEDAGYTYDRILTHYYTGTEVVQMEETPETTVYPTLVYSEELGYETFQWLSHPTEELLARIVYQEIYGVTEGGEYEESLKALTLCVFSNLAYYDFDIESRWDVGIASPLSYEELPENLKTLVGEVYGQYISVKGENAPIMAVFSGLAAGMTASSEDIWGGYLSYLTPVPSPFDMKREGFVTSYLFTEEEIKNLILSYDNTIKLQDDPSQWLQIVEHTGSIDEQRGYVTKIRVGDKVLRGYNEFLMGIMGNCLRSPCYIITYTP